MMNTTLQENKKKTVAKKKKNNKSSQKKKREERICKKKLGRNVAKKGKIRKSSFCWLRTKNKNKNAQNN